MASKEERLVELVKSHWDIPGLLADLREQKWTQTEPNRIDRLAWIGSYDTIQNLASQSVPDEEWDDAVQEGFDDEIVEEYLETLGEVLVDATGKELRREHIYTSMEEGEVFIGQYEDISPDELRAMGFEIGGGSLGASKPGPRARVRGTRYGPLSVETVRVDRNPDAFDVTIRDDYGNVVTLPAIVALNHRQAARGAIRSLESKLHDPSSAYHQEALQFGELLEEAVEEVEAIAEEEEGESFVMGQARPKKRVPLSRAMKLAAQVERQLDPFADALILVGSIRRKRPEVGDIEFVILPKGWESQGEMEEFAETLKRRGFAVGAKLRKATKVIKGIKVEVYIAHHPDELGGLVFMYTGDFQFNIAMRRKAKRMGYRLNQYGIFDAAGNPVLQSPDEREFFDFLGVDYHWPEERSVATRTPEEKRKRAAAKRKKRPAKRARSARRRSQRRMAGLDDEFFERLDGVWDDDWASKESEEE